MKVNGLQVNVRFRVESELRGVICILVYLLKLNERRT